MSELLDKILFQKLFLKWLTGEVLLLLFLFIGLIFLIRAVSGGKYRSVVTLIVLFLVASFTLQYTNIGRLFVLGINPKSNRAKIEFKARQPIHNDKTAVCFIGSSQANCAIDEKVLSEQLFPEGKKGGVLDLSYRGSVPSSVLANVKFYRLAEKFDTIIYYVTDRDFFLPEVGPVYDPNLSQEGISLLVAKVFPTWISSSIAPKITGKNFNEPEKLNWKPITDDEQKNKALMLQGEFNLENGKSSEQALMELTEHCVEHDCKLVFCIGWTNPSVVEDFKYRDKLEESVSRIISSYSEVLLFKSPIEPEIKDFKDLTHTNEDFQNAYSKGLSMYLLNNL